MQISVGIHTHSMDFVFGNSESNRMKRKGRDPLFSNEMNAIANRLPIEVGCMDIRSGQMSSFPE